MRLLLVCRKTFLSVIILCSALMRQLILFKNGKGLVVESKNSNLQNLPCNSIKLLIANTLVVVTHEGNFPFSSN